MMSLYRFKTYIFLFRSRASRENAENQATADVIRVTDSGAIEDLVEWQPYGFLSKAEFKDRAWRNILVLSVSNMLVYISFLGLIDLQSSLHVQEGK